MSVHKSNRVRAPLMTTFRNAHAQRDAKLRSDGRDESGEQVVEGRRASRRSAVSAADLQKAVSQDLEVLMNSVNLAASLDLRDYPEVRRSILNHGFPDTVHRSIDEISVNDIGHEIQMALTAYETRLLPGSIQVRRDTHVDLSDLKIRFFVRADLNCDPLNVPVEFVADLERATGKIIIGRP